MHLHVSDRLERLAQDHAESVSLSARHELISAASRVASCAAAARRYLGSDPAQAGRFLSDIEESAFALASLVSKFLLYLQWSKEGEPPRPGTADLAAEALDAIEQVGDRYPERRRDIRSAIPPSPIPIAAPPDRMRVAIEETLENALQYSEPASPVEIRIDPDGTEVTVDVRDRGIGIREEDRDRVCAPFFRTAAARGKVRHGMGLGLTLASMAVRAAHGRLEVDGGTGGGARVLMRIPLAAE